MKINNLIYTDKDKEILKSLFGSNTDRVIELSKTYAIKVIHPDHCKPEALAWAVFKITEELLGYIDEEAK